MFKDLVIIGNGSFAKLLGYYITEYSEYNVKAFSVNSEYLLKMNNSSGGGGKPCFLLGVRNILSTKRG